MKKISLQLGLSNGRKATVRDINCSGSSRRPIKTFSTAPQTSGVEEVRTESPSALPSLPLPRTQKLVVVAVHIGSRPPELCTAGQRHYENPRGTQRLPRVPQTPIDPRQTRIAEHPKNQTPNVIALYFHPLEILLAHIAGRDKIGPRSNQLSSPITSPRVLSS